MDIQKAATKVQFLKNELAVLRRTSPQTPELRENIAKMRSEMQCLVSRYNIKTINGKPVYKVANTSVR